MSKTRKERLHERTRTEIKQIALRQMEARGLNALSLRAIASEMGLTPPALYYYFGSRDELVSALAEDAFASLEDSITQALSVVQEHDHIDRVIAMFTTYREWALSNHLGYNLVMGEGAPDPAERATFTRRSIERSYALFREAWMTGVLRLHKIHLPPELRAQYAALSKQFTTNIPAKIVYILMMIWFTFRGMIAFELSGQLAVSGEDTSSWFHHIFLNLLRDNGFDLTDYLQEQQHIQAN